MKANPSSTYNWLCKTIETCNSPLQLETAERLIENFKKQVNDSRYYTMIYGKFKNKAEQLEYYK